MSTNRSPLKLSRKSSTEEIIVSEHLSNLRNRVRLLTWVSGLCWTSLALFGGLLITGTLDWLLHFDESGTRLVIGLSLLGLAGWMFWRQLIAPLLTPLSATFLANRVEKRFPGLNNRLLSAVEFLEHRLDSKLGSTELQKAVVGQALSDLELIETSDVIETKAVRNVTIAGAVVTFLTALVVMLHPLEAATSVKRLAFPFSKVPWPRNVDLKLVRPDLSPVIHTPDQPLVIARGDTLELYVENKRGRLPERVWFEYRNGDDGPISREALRQTTLRDEKGRSREAAVISWVATRGTMQFRASGGDDNVMPFYQVDVVPPPNLESLQVTVTPPTYSHQPVQVLPPGVGHVHGLLGSKVEVIATSDKSLQSARLRVGEQPAVAMPLQDESRRFSSIFEIKEAVNGSYWFELTDNQGFTDRDAVRYELRGIADGIPDVTIESPVSDLLLTADSELAVSVLAKDDLGLQQVRVSYQVGDEEKPRVITLYNHSASDREQEPPGQPGSSTDPKQVGPQRHQAGFVWKMSDLNPQPGMRIVFRGEATDAYDLGQPHVGKSIPRTITIVSRDEKQRELAMRVGDLLEDLQQATQMQKRARQQTQDLQTQLEKVGELRSQDLDQLQRTELDQRQTASRLTNPADSVETQTRQLLDEFRANRLGDDATEQRLEQVAAELNRLERDELSDAERALTQAQKLAEEGTDRDTAPLDNKSDSKTTPLDAKSKVTKNTDSSASLKRPNAGEKSGDSTSEQVEKEEKLGNEQTPGTPQLKTDSNDSPSPNQSKSISDENSTEKSKDLSQSDTLAASKKGLRSALAEAQAQQARSLESLTELQDLLSEWRDQRDVSKDLSSVISEQEKVQQDAENMAQQTISKSSAELSRQEKAELDKLAVRQRRVAEQLGQLRKQLDKAAENLKGNDPDSAEKLSEVGQELNQHETASKLQDAADKISENRMGAAAESQKQAIEDLHELERMMKRQPNEDTEQFLKQTQEALQEFQQLREEQQSIADRAEELNQQDDSLEKTQKQDELMQQQEDLTERMAKAERKLERLRLRGAADAAHRARKRITEMMKHIQEAEDGEEMQQAMEEALDDLEQVERELVLEKRIAQDRLAFEQLEKIEDQLKSLRTRQEAAMTETIRLEDAKKDEGRITRGQIKTLLELAETERSLQHTAEQMGQQMVSAEVFSLVLKRLARSMMHAADGLSERETSEKTQAFERDALRKIDNLLAVLKQEQKKQPPEKPQDKPEELSQEPQEKEEKPEEAQPPGDMLPQLAQLKLLKSLQEEYLERTELLEKFRGKDGKLPEAMQEEKDDLAREQSELADFARNLITKFLQQQADRKDEKQPEDKVKEREKDLDAKKIAP